MRSNHQVLKLFPNVIPVKGYNRSVLVDLQNGKPHLVPNDLIEYLEQDKLSEIEEYVNFILDNELGLMIDRELSNCLTSFPENYHPTSKISNSILELDENSTWDINSILNQLDELGTQFLEVRFLDHLSLLNNLKTFQEYSAGTTIESIQIMVPYSEDLKHFLDSALAERFFRLSTIVVYNAPSGFELDTDCYNLIFSSQESVSHENCGNVSIDSFVVNTQAYSRNLNYNSCLAHKMSIDKDGFICNCPSISSKFSHANITKLTEVLYQKEFQDKWTMTKDKVLICSVCEFRSICTDCRAFTLNDLDNGKPSKCSYNPFISLWADEENYLSEKECGISFTGNTIQISEDKLNQINARIWE
jgi:SPASM domain peptide maturase of grasp-with-spasm system